MFNLNLSALVTTVKVAIKKALSDSNDTNYKLINGQWLSNHDQAHIYISTLSPIRIGKDWVDGISGVPIPEFNREGLPSYYSPYLDECRVGIHQMLTNKTLASYVRGGYWLGWLVIKCINPINVVIAHWRSMNEN